MITMIPPVFTEILLFFGSIVILLLDVFKVGVRHSSKYALIVLFCVALILVYPLSDGLSYEGLFLNSAYTTLIKLSVVGLTAFLILSMSQFIEKYPFNKAEHTVMILFMVTGVCVMVSSNHFIMLYVGMEIQALSAYTLTMMQRKSSFAAEAGVKYFILGSLASVVYLFGVSYIYGASGTLYFHALTEYASVSTAMIGMVLILSAFFFKLGLFPFHQWVPDVYQGASTPTTAILSKVPKVVGVAVLIRLLVGPFHDLLRESAFETVIGLISATSMIVGAVVPIVQTHLKRLLAYSAIGHMGFMLIGLYGLSADGIAAAIAYVLIYGLTTIMVFVCMMSLKGKSMNSDELDDIDIHYLSGLAQVRPKHAFTLAVCFLSMAGVPPLIGFFPKLLLIQHALTSKAVVLTGVAVTTTIIGLFYYLRLIKLMYMDVPGKQVVQMHQKLNKRLFLIFLPFILIQLLGCYIPVFQAVYQEAIMSAAKSIVLFSNEKNHL